MASNDEQTMQTRDEYPAGVPCFVDSGRRDSGPARDFYGGLFGWEFQNVAAPGGPPWHAASLRGLTVAGIGTQPEMDWEPVWNTYVRVEDADAAAAAVRDAGGTVTMEPFAIGAAGRMVAFVDPAGAGLCLWEPGETPGVQLVNEPGAWVFSGLNTGDRAGAEAFYGAVFGWTFGPAAPDGSAMIMKPGYVDFLSARDPELPERLERFQAPEGFGDVVARLGPLSGDALAHWDITFSVADTDASVARARELGGEVVVEPVDRPYVRLAVLRDPDGVAFNVSQFNPPD